MPSPKRRECAFPDCENGAEFNCLYCDRDLCSIHYAIRFRDTRPIQQGPACLPVCSSPMWDDAEKGAQA